MVRDFPSEIPFWIKIEGVPTEFWSTPTFQSIGDAIGETTDVDLDYGKMRVIIDGRKELCFETTVDFKGGEYYEEEEALVTLQFEKLCGHCSLCLSLCHDLGNCTLNPNPEKKKESREGAAVRKDDRARSYKGVVTNGEGGHQENDKNPRRYQGKGKGKMYEEQESKWERVPERGSKRSFSNRNHNKFEEGGSRNRNSRRRGVGHLVQHAVKETHYEVKEVLCAETERSHAKKEKFGLMGVIGGGCNKKWRRV